MDGRPLKHMKMETHEDAKPYRHMHIQTHDNENGDSKLSHSKKGLPSPGRLPTASQNVEEVERRGLRGAVGGGAPLPAPCGGTWRITGEGPPKIPAELLWSCPPLNPLAEGSLLSSLICHRMGVCVRAGAVPHHSSSPWVRISTRR